VRRNVNEALFNTDRAHNPKLGGGKSLKGALVPKDEGVIKMKGALVPKDEGVIKMMKGRSPR